MSRHLLLGTTLVVTLLFLAASAPAQPMTTQPAQPAGGAAAAPAKPTAPASTRPTAPTVDHVKDLFDLYSQGEERSRFFGAAGVDGELTDKEFSAASGKPKSLVRSYDRWEMAIGHDKDANGKLNWPEAEQYRLSVQQRVLGLFDRNKDRKLLGGERDAANSFLARGLRAPGFAPAGVPAGRGEDLPGAPGEAGRSGRGGRGQLLGQMQAQYDTNQDGRLSNEERQAMQQTWRNQWELRRYDRNNDGKLDEEETAARDAEREQQRRRMEQWQQQWEELRARHDADKDGQLSSEERQALFQEMRERAELARFDRNKDGKLDEQETAARDAERQRRRRRGDQLRSRMAERRREWIQRWDADGDGALSDQERSKMTEQLAAAVEKRRQEMDADGDGNISTEEARSYWQKLRQKYDEDGDGELSPEEREKMNQQEMQGLGRDPGRGQGRGGMRRRRPSGN